tara:strand:- start:87242 stop:89518 length:2277 start_codon:yes stop_codon:yes gene_type:complete
MGNLKKEALEYHSSGRPGKIEVIPTKPYGTQHDLALAYSPGVAAPCNEIAEDVNKVFDYTSKGNLIGVISNGTAVLGLGDIGPEASKPVMEGKGILFKVFADIDVFDIELDARDPDLFVQTVKAMAPTFGGINLEDIKAPEAFDIEERLKKELNIPIMHDDQHGTAIVSAAALLNALELAGKKIGDVKIVISGAGAAAISCSRLYISLGVNVDNLIMCDSKGVIHKNRENLDKRKAQFATDNKATDLEEALVGADVFLGLSKGNIMTPKMLLSMADNPIVFACANPDPEIDYDLAMDTRKDIIMATGRSDHPNQVNNVLGFPYIFRGALDVRASSINEEMKLAAVKALAALAKEPIPEEVSEAYGERNLKFDRTNIIPKPVDPRLITRVSIAVAKAAIESGVAQKPITDWNKYKLELNQRLGLEKKLFRNMTMYAKQSNKKVVFAEAEAYKVLRAAQTVRQQRIATPILLGNRAKIESIIEEYNLSLSGVEIIDPKSVTSSDMQVQYANDYFESRKRKGVTLYDAKKAMTDRNYFGSMLVKNGYADAFVSGITRSYAEVLRPALRVMGVEQGVNKVAGMYVILAKDKPYFFADTTVNVNPTAEEIAEIAHLTYTTVKKFGIKPNLALLSYSNFGSTSGADADKMRLAREIIIKKYPEITVDGDIQANFAVNQDLLKEIFPFSSLVGESANTFIFPNLSAGNISYKLLHELAGIDAVGPILMGMKHSMHVLTHGCTVNEIVNMVTIAVMDARFKQKELA